MPLSSLPEAVGRIGRQVALLECPCGLGGAAAAGAAGAVRAAEWRRRRQGQGREGRKILDASKFEIASLAASSVPCLGRADPKGKHCA